jgi:tungstate transport system substrate-binding protein
MSYIIKSFLKMCFFWSLVTNVFAATPSTGQVLRLSTTTSTENSGLLKFLLPEFEAQSGLQVQVISVGSGKALELAKNGDVDVTLVHARAAEDQFIADGHGVKRVDVMYNDFIIVGPAADPAKIHGEHDVLRALDKIAASGARFVSRGDKSGTDQKEQTYWKQLGRRPQTPAYISAGVGMGEALMMAAELKAYTLTDRATFGSYRARTGLQVLMEGDVKMFNPYGIMAVNPARHPNVNYLDAQRLIRWITSETGRKKIAAFRVDGQQLFFPLPASK